MRNDNTVEKKKGFSFKDKEVLNRIKHQISLDKSLVTRRLFEITIETLTLSLLPSL